jgi:tryptophan-rich sensory protein
MVANNSVLLKWSNIIAFAFTVIVNSLAGSTAFIGGVNTAQISDSNPTLITPAGYVFAIWGIIYVLLGVFVIFQALPSQKEKEYTKKIGWLFVLSSIMNIALAFPLAIQVSQLIRCTHVPASGNFNLDLPTPWNRQVSSHVG